MKRITWFVIVVQSSSHCWEWTREGIKRIIGSVNIQIHTSTHLVVTSSCFFRCICSKVVKYSVWLRGNGSSMKYISKNYSHSDDRWLHPIIRPICCWCEKVKVDQRKVRSRGRRELIGRGRREGEGWEEGTVFLHSFRVFSSLFRSFNSFSLRLHLDSFFHYRLSVFVPFSSSSHCFLLSLILPPRLHQSCSHSHLLYFSHSEMTSLFSSGFLTLNGSSLTMVFSITSILAQILIAAVSPKVSSHLCRMCLPCSNEWLWFSRRGRVVYYPMNWGVHVLHSLLSYRYSHHFRCCEKKENHSLHLFLDQCKSSYI